MHDTRALALLVLLSTAVAGCDHLQHNDVLIFATETKLALDVSSSAVSGGAPSFTLGYKRAEGVWMPLVINGRSSTVLNGNKACNENSECWAVGMAALEAFRLCAAKETAPPVACLNAMSQDVKYVGSDPGRTDTYSVFASFGADTGASGGGKATLAQFFATGIAAQQLAANKNVENALIAKEAGPAQVDAANKAANEAKAERDAALRALGVPQIDVTATNRLAVVDAAMSCWRDNRATYRSAATERLTADYPALVTVLNGENEGQVRTSVILETTPDGAATALDGVTKTVCSNGG